MKESIKVKDQVNIATLLVYLTVLSMFLPLLYAGNVLADTVPSSAPLNPAFVNYIKARDIERLQTKFMISDINYGYIPSPIDYSYLENLPVALLGRQRNLDTLPTSYDLRSLSKVTPVKYQGSCGDCWAFASMSSLESDLLISSSTTWDFSENNIKNTNGFDMGACGGGNSEMAIAYLARWDGPVNEADDPYNESSAISPTGLTIQKHLQQAIIFPPPSVADLTSIKEAIQQYGGLMASYYHDDSYYNSSTHGYYYAGSSSSNHLITLVGWNDNFAASNFLTSPSGNGAFIVKNSWGTSWGDAGYFYISYYDLRILQLIRAINGADETSNYSRIYQYDPLGKTGTFGYSGVTSAWGANVFTAAASESIGAVSFYAASPGTTYTIKIYTNVGATPTSGILTHTQSGSVTLPGYHTIKLSSVVKVTSGQKFSVAMLLDTPGYNYPLPIEIAIGGYSSGASASAGQSYYAYNNGGTPGIWYDITTWDSTTNICIKAFAINSPINQHDFNADGKTDFIWQNTNTGQLYYWLMDGLNLSSSGYLYDGKAIGLEWRIDGIADMNSDGKPDIIWRNTTTGQLYCWLMDGVILSSSGYIYGGQAVDLQWQIAGVGDMNSDGKPDLIWRNTSTGQLYYWLMDGLNLSSSGYLYGGQVVDLQWQIAGVADMNSDGKPDLIWRNTSTGQVYYWLMDGLNLSSSGYLYGGQVVDLQWQLAGIADMNSDGKPDIIWRNTTTGQLYCWLMDGVILSSSGYLYDGNSVGLAWQLRLK